MRHAISLARFVLVPVLDRAIALYDRAHGIDPQGDYQAQVARMRAWNSTD